jgi:serine/threonine protein phosphatase 1
MGQTWWFELPAEQREAIVSAFEALPLAFEVSSAGGVVGIVHAEPVPGMAWALFVEKLEESDAAAMESCLWGREFAEGRAKGEIEGVWRVFGGHSPMVDGLGRFGNMYCVDTGAVFGRHGVAKDGHLTLARIDAPDLELISKRSGDGLVEIKGAELSPASRISRKAALE